MNDLNELRRVLDDRAASVDDHLAPAQPAAVHRRIAAIRRRRRTAAAGALAAAVVVAGSAVVLPRLGGDEGPEPTSLVGVDVPDTMDSLGFTYELVDTVSGKGSRAVLDLPASDQSRLVSWATSGDDDRVTLSGDLVVDPWSTDAADFSDFTLVPAGDGGQVVIEAASGTPGIAVYRATGERPAGYTRDGITFREEFAGGHLLAAVVGEPGQGEIDLPATADGPGVAVKLFCIGGPEAADTVLDLGGRPAITAGGGCADRTPLDPAAHGGSDFPTRVGEDVSVRVEIRSGGSAVVDDDMVVAVGIYSLDAYAPAPRGPAPTTLEHDGRVWRLVHVADSSRAEQVAELAPEGRGEILAVMTAGTGERLIDVTFGDRPGVRISAGESASLQQVVSAGEAVRIRQVGGKPLGDVRVSFYERVR
ncbi:hypothetical protein ACFQ0K_16290 [Nocardioides caeni]|uniref:Uncharacterized protein n=1 Tax=Nocardioides caeni TaxID=574700 RepID=A0A4S8NH73_9ACTN|nr:hypothetical protein [Nocardioides caeni]THV16113.1 hypothetical protein E9934_07225 [Nocardioides caeni]